MRGYDRERVDRFLARVADAYSLVWGQSQALRERLRSLEAEVAAAQAEAEASARAVAQLTQQTSPGNVPPPSGVEALAALERRLERAESERAQALADLQQMSNRASELGKRVAAIENEPNAREQLQAATAESAVPDAEAARLLLAATRAADDVRAASRTRALRTLTRARELSALVNAQTERERANLAEAEERRRQADSEAERIVAQARAEAAAILGAIEDERKRVRELLTGALTSLEAEAAVPRGNLIGDLAPRLDLSSNRDLETTEPTAT
jgi:cell division septum initiation protein DivIVA